MMMSLGHTFLISQRSMSMLLLLLLLNCFSSVRLCATPQTAAHQAPPTLGLSRQEHWSGLPFPSPMHDSEVAQSCPTLRDPMEDPRLLLPCDFPEKGSGVGCYCLLHYKKVKKKKRISESRCICMPELEVWGGHKDL